MKVSRMAVGPIGTNCYIVYENKEALVIDPGGDANRILDFLNKEKLSAKAILLTHAHFDRIGAVGELRSQLELEVYIHGKENSWLGDPRLNGSASFTGNKIVTGPAEYLFDLGDTKIANFNFKVIHTPGHSPGSVSFIFDEQKFIVSGDVLFKQGIGRTDLPGGNTEELEASIRYKLYTLDETFTVYPGHGPETMIKDEKRNNPFFKES